MRGIWLAVCYFRLAHFTSRRAYAHFCWFLPASGLLILAMAWLPPFILVLLIRFLAGVASAGMLIFGSTLIMQHTRHPFVLAALFSGVGIGIALGNEYVLAGLHFAFSSQTLWQGAGALSGMMLIALTLLMPSKNTPSHQCHWQKRSNR